MPQIHDVPVTPQLTTDLQHYAAAVRDGFGERPFSEEGLDRWHGMVRQDQTRLRAIYDDRGFGLEGRPVATFASLAGTINTGTELLPANCITDVTVLSSHRRRGLMQQLMRHDLAEARERGDVFAALTATDARIYGRFGFGVTTTSRHLELNAGRDFGLRTEPTGTTVFADPEAISDLRRSLFQRWHEGQFWSLTRHAHYWGARFDWEAQTATHDRAAVHLDADGEPDGALVFSQHDGKIVIQDLLGLTPAAELELIRLIAHLEGHEKIVWRTCHDPRHPLVWALEDRRAMRVIRDSDSLWVRILDVERALASRRYEFDGEVAFQLSDPLDEMSGTYRLRVENGRAAVGRSDAEAPVSLQISALSSLYSGLATPYELSVAGLVTGDSAALEGLGRVFALTKPGISASLF